MNIAKLFLLFILYSFIGWAYESIYVSILEKKPVNRGFLNGPLIPIYGAGALLVILVFRHHSENVISLFISSAVLISILEYITSWGMEKMFHARWWDYSTHKFHINGRVCLDGAAVFGAFSVLLIIFLNPFINSMLDRLLPKRAQEITSGILFVVFAADVFITINHVLNLNLRLKLIQEAYDKYSGQISAARSRLTVKIAERFENSVFYTKAIHKLVTYRRFQDIRLIKAFPRATFLRFKEAWERLKDNIQGQ
jgi:uncharacterized membrane protein